MLAAAGLPFGPVAIEQRRVDAGFGRRLGIGVEAALVARVVEGGGGGRSAFGIHVGLEHEFLAIGGDEQAAGFGGEARDQAGVGAVGIHDPDLRGPAAIGDEVDLVRIGGPTGTLIVIAVAGELAGRAAVDGDHVNLFGTGVRGEIGSGDGVGYEFAVGRKSGLGDALDAEESFDVEGALLREDEGRRQQQQKREARGPDQTANNSSTRAENPGRRARSSSKSSAVRITGWAVALWM